MLGGADTPNGELPSYITGADSWQSVSYTHLDVYKRQVYGSSPVVVGGT